MHAGLLLHKETFYMVKRNKNQADFDVKTSVGSEKMQV